MNFYKEIFLDFENNCKITPQVFNLFSVDNKSERIILEENARKSISKKACALSFDYYIVQW